MTMDILPSQQHRIIEEDKFGKTFEKQSKTIEEQRNLGLYNPQIYIINKYSHINHKQNRFKLYSKKLIKSRSMNELKKLLEIEQKQRGKI